MHLGFSYIGFDFSYHVDDSKLILTKNQPKDLENMCIMKNKIYSYLRELRSFSGLFVADFQ